MKNSFLQSRATRDARRAYFGRWRGERESPIAKEILEGLLSLKSQTQREIPTLARVSEVYL